MKLSSVFINTIRKSFLVVLFICIMPINYAYNGKVLVCLSPSSKKYHSGYCAGMKNCTHHERWMSIGEAEAIGRNPCKFCFKY